MKTLDNITQANQAMWEAEVQKGGGYTQPWLDLDVAELRQLMAGRLDPFPKPLYELFPYHLLQDVAGKDVLCLAAGGGQHDFVPRANGEHTADQLFKRCAESLLKQFEHGGFGKRPYRFLYQCHGLIDVECIVNFDLPKE